VFGMDASAAWSWEKWDKPKGDWTLGMWLYRPRATEEYVRTGMDLMRLMPEIIALRNAPCEVAVLHSRTTALRNPKYAQYIQRIFAVLQEMGIPVTVVPEQSVADGELRAKLPHLKALILPGLTHLPDKVYGILKREAAEHDTRIKVIGVGEDICRFNEFCQARSDDFLVEESRCYQKIPFEDAQSLRTSFDSALRRCGATRNFTLIGDATQQPARGVFYRTVRTGGRLIATVVNLTSRPAKCHWVGADGRELVFKDRLSLKAKPPAKTMRLEGFDVRFGELGGNRRQGIGKSPAETPK